MRALRSPTRPRGHPSCEPRATENTGEVLTKTRPRMCQTRAQPSGGGVSGSTCTKLAAARGGEAERARGQPLTPEQLQPARPPPAVNLTRCNAPAMLRYSIPCGSTVDIAYYIVRLSEIGTGRERNFRLMGCGRGSESYNAQYMYSYDTCAVFCFE